MIGLYHPKLAPGERLIQRQPAALTKSQWQRGVVVAVVAGAGIFAFFHWIYTGDSALPGKLLSLIVVLQLLGLVSLRNSWTVAVTDRRLLVKRMAFWRKPREIPIDEIDGIAMDIVSHRILVRGGGQEIGIRPERIDLPELKEALGHAADGAA